MNKDTPKNIKDLCTCIVTPHKSSKFYFYESSMDTHRKNLTLYKEQVKNQIHVLLSRNFEIRTRNYEEKSLIYEKNKS